MNNVSIIMPSYNEEKRISRTLEAYSNYFENLRKSTDLEYEILIVINNTTDKTEEIVKKAQKQNSRIKYLNFKQGGKGFAVIEGFKDALLRSSDLIGFVDADLSTLPEDFYDLVKNLKDSRHDGVIAGRYMKSSIINPKPTIQRLISSRVFNFLIRSVFLMPYRDTQCGAKLFKQHAIKKIINKLSMSKWAFDVELLYQLRKNNFIIKEFPTKWSDQEYSHIYLMKAGPMMALSIIRLRLINSPLKDVVRLYNKIFNLMTRQK